MSAGGVPQGFHQETITRAALSGQWHLGMLYDAVKDRPVLGASIFSQKRWEESQKDAKLWEQVENRNYSDYLETTDTLESKADKMSVQASLKLSFMGGLIDVQGSGSYLNDTKTSWSVERVTFSKSAKTYYEVLHVLNMTPDMPKQAQSLGATHIVTGIQYGVEARLVFGYQCSSSSEQQEVRGWLKLAIGRIPGVDISGEGSVEIDQEKKKRLNKLNVTYHGNVALPKSVTTYAEAVEAWQYLGKLTPGDSMPVQIFLLPLSIFETMPAVKLALDIEDDIVKKLSREYQRLKDQLLQAQSMQSSTLCVKFDRFAKEVSGFVQYMDIFLTKFQIKLQELLPAIRLRRKDQDELNQLIEDTRNSVFCEEDCGRWLRHAQSCVDLIESYLMAAPGLMPVANEQDLKFKAASSRAENCLCFYITLGPLAGCQVRAMQAHFFGDEQKRKQLEDELRQEHEEETKNADVDGFAATGRSFIDFMVENASSNTEFLLALNIDSESPCDLCASVWWYRVGKPQKGFNLPAQVTGLCEVGAGPSTIMLQWDKPATNGHSGFVISYRKKPETEDAESGGTAEWSFDRLHVEAHVLGAKIPNLDKQTAYEVFVQTTSEIGHGKKSLPVTVHTTLEQREEYNMLVLGETGVGKSTFINALCNFISFPSLADAEKKGVQTVMPASFKQSVRGEPKLIKVGGTDENEHFGQQGASVTQEPKCYPFEFSSGVFPSYKINIIDTPGMGDTRGLEMDRLNTAAIVRHLEPYGHIDAILILLQPNLPRLTSNFKYCVLELFKNLHKDCAKSIFFVFTRSRETMYEPGDTLPNLQVLLKELREHQGVDIPCNPSTYFCMDSEAFRYLACRENGVELPNARQEDYAESWTTSVHAVQRMMRRMMGSRPFQTSRISDLFKARMLVVQLSKPMAEVHTYLIHREQEVQKIKQEVQEVDTNIQDLDKILKKKEAFGEVEKLKEPCTVCTGDGCSKLVDNCRDYKVCHHMCRLSVPSEQVHNPQLRNCACMEYWWGRDKAKCGCGHDWRMHMHIYYKVVMKEKLVTDGAVKERQNAAKTLKQEKQDQLTNLDKLMSELNDEKQFIEQSACKMAAFLKANGICPVNDAVEEHLQQEINNLETDIMLLEKDGAHFDGRVQKKKEQIQLLKKSKDAHVQERDLLLKSMDRASKTGVVHDLSAGGIIQLKKQLENQKHSGKWIRSALAEFEKHMSPSGAKIQRAPTFKKPKAGKYEKSKYLDIVRWSTLPTESTPKSSL